MFGDRSTLQILVSHGNNAVIGRI